MVFEGSCIDETFKRRFGGNPQFVSDFGDFKKIKEGSLLGILLKDSSEFIAFLEKKEIGTHNQKIYLQYEEIISIGRLPVKKETKVTEYIFPLEGRISTDYFLNNKSKDYKVVD
ncbi:MAG: hypothetical protein NTZ83_00685 [Candidatus Pacearchaeota archaeon]|nr:hypothetical protein [Candidatus Pacearchaeota archaeon]